MRRVSRPLAVLAMIGLLGTVVRAQVSTKPGTRPPAAATSHRTLTGKVGAAREGGQVLTLNVAEGAAKTWSLSLGKQTLLLRANKNGQYSELAPGDVKKGDAVQALVDLAADPSDQTHRTWWLVVYPAGTTPSAR